MQHIDFPSPLATEGRVPLEQTVVDSFGFLPAHLRRVALGIPSRLQRTRPSAGGFSLLEHACHLRDYEAEGIQLRMVRILGESAPALADFPGDRLAVERKYNEQDFSAALRSFESKRRETQRLLSGLSDPELERKADFGSEGRVSLRRMIAIFAEHDVTHRHELDELAAEISTASARPV
jgi:DinB superfamily